MKNYAILHPGETLDDCFRICRDTAAGFEKYDFKTNRWESDEELWGIYWGEPEVEEITEAQTNEIIDRVRKRLKGASAGNRRA